MVEVFGHEKLKVYQRGLEFVVMRKDLLGGISKKVAACDHLDRASESILLNIAHASSSWSAKDRIISLGYANGSALECAACLDVLVAKMLLTVSDVCSCKSHIREIVSMLIAMRKTASHIVRETSSDYYVTTEGGFFSHEKLDVYQAALWFVRWVEDISVDFSGSADLYSKLDKSSTAIVLNIAEGNGRFGGIDHVKFLRIAYRAAIQSASLVDLAMVGNSFASEREKKGQEMLRRIAAMLTSLSKVVSKTGSSAKSMGKL